MARDFWLRLFGSRPSSPQPAAANAGHRHHPSNSRPVRTPSPLPTRVETAEKVATDALQADRARMRWLELEVARVSALAAAPTEEMQTALQEQKQDYVTRLLRFQIEAQSSKEQADQLRQEVSRLRSKVHQRGFEVLAQQQLLQAAQQQLAQQEAQVADAKSACAGLSVRVEALCVKAVAAANMLDGAMKQPAGTANVQLGAGISKCMEVLQGLMQLPDTMAQLNKAAAAAATAAAAPASMPATDSQKQQQQQKLISAAELAAHLEQQQQQQALWSPSPADMQQLPSNLWVKDDTPRHASCPTDNPSSPHSPGPAAAAPAAGGMFADAGRQQPKACGGNAGGSNSRLQSRSVSPEFWRIAQGIELMGGGANDLPRPQSHTGVTARLDDPTFSCTRTRGSRRYSSDDGDCSDRGSNGGCGGYRGSNGGCDGYTGSNGCRPAAHTSNYPASHASHSNSRLPQLPVPLARLKARRLSDRAAAAAAVAAAPRSPRSYSSSGPGSPAAAAAAVAAVGGAYGSKYSSAGGSAKQGDENESVWLTPRFPQLAMAAPERAQHKAFADEQRCDGRQQQATAGEGAWAIPAARSHGQPAVLAEQQVRDIFRRQYQKQQQQQQQQQERQQSLEPYGAGFAGGYEERDFHQQQQQQQHAGHEAWGSRGQGSAEVRHGAVQPAQAQAYWRSMEEAQQYSSRAGPGGRACDSSSSHMGSPSFAHSQGNKPQERPDKQQQQQHHQQQSGGVSVMSYIGAVPGSTHHHQEQQQHPPQQQQQQQQQNYQQQSTYQQQPQPQQRYRSLSSAERFGSGSLAAQDKQLQYQQQQARQEAREQEQSELWLQQKQHQLRQLQQMRALVEERVGNMHLHLADEQFQKHRHEEQ